MAQKKSKSKKGGKPARTATKRITGRVVSSKRHTVGYVIGSKRLTVEQARKEAQSGKIAGVRVVGNHIQAAKGAKPLSSLPEHRDR